MYECIHHLKTKLISLKLNYSGTEDLRAENLISRFLETDLCEIYEHIHH
jgi:hypothetical protein